VRQAGRGDGGEKRESGVDLHAKYWFACGGIKGDGDS
jgi:hypothetical protein